MIHLEKQYWRHSKEVLVSRTMMLLTKLFPEIPRPSHVTMACFSCLTCKIKTTKKAIPIMYGISHRFRNKIHVHANLLYFVLKILYSVNILI